MDVQARTPTDSSEAANKKASLEQIPGGRYHIVERLSTGAIGAVYKALDTVLDRPVAVKCVKLDTPFADHSPDELRERFVREARIAARLQHASIVTTHDIVATETRGFIIMEFIEGQSLEALLKAEGRLSLSKAIRVVSQLSDALDYAHARNVVHRDVKPSNILVSPSMNVWVTDFGIAKSELSTNLTMAGGVLGTPDYMSPEQAKGEDVDARSDLFSLGCVLFECVTGEKPFRSPSLTGVLLSIINDEPVFPLNWKSLGLPTGLKPILHHALEKSRDKRYPLGSALVEALEALPAEDVARADEAAKRREEVEEEVAEAPASPAKASASADEPSDDSSGESEKQEAATEPETETTDDDVAPPPEESGPQEQVAAAEASDRPEEASSDEAGADTVEEAAASPEPPPTEEPAEDEAAAEPEPTIDAVRLEELKADGRPLKLSPSLSGALQGLEISPEEGFILSRVDGVSRASEILALSPMPEAQSALALQRLLDKELIEFVGAQIDPPKPSPAKARPAPKVPDAAKLAEIERLLALAADDAWAELLGVEPGAEEAACKRAYLKLIGQYHPDKFSWAKENGFQEKLSRLCAAASEAVDELALAREEAESDPKPQPGQERRNGGAPAADTRSAGETTGGFDKRKYARELHDRAMRSFDIADFWDTIQLSRQAIEVDDGQPEFHFLLGRALMQNKRWRKEAADAFRKASELEPMNVQYLGLLGAVYKAEGLSARAEAVLKKVREIDSEYELPAIDGDAEPSITSG